MMVLKFCIIQFLEADVISKHMQGFDMKGLIWNFKSSKRLSIYGFFETSNIHQAEKLKFCLR